MDGHLSARVRRRAETSLLGVLVVLLAGCAGSSGTTAPARLHGVDMRDRSLSLTDHDLSAPFRSTRGATTTSLGALDADGLMLLYFGYTHCPDVCPTTMAQLAAGLRRLPQEQQARVQVVFVTSDPERDTPAVMKAWLANFDGGLARPFVGLTASSRQIDAVAKTLHILIAPPVRHKNGSITVEHGAETIAFDDRRAQVLWSSGTLAREYASDLKVLLG